MINGEALDKFFVAIGFTKVAEKTFKFQKAGVEQLIAVTADI